MEFRPRNCRRKVEAVYNLLEEIKAMGGVQADWLPPKIVVTSPAGKKHYVLFHRVKVHKGVVYLDIDSHENGPVYELKDDDSIEGIWDLSNRITLSPMLFHYKEGELSIDPMIKQDQYPLLILVLEKLVELGSAPVVQQPVETKQNQEIKTMNDITTAATVTATIAIPVEAIAPTEAAKAVLPPLAAKAAKPAAVKKPTAEVIAHVANAFAHLKTGITLDDVKNAFGEFFNPMWLETPDQQWEDHVNGFIAKHGKLDSGVYVAVRKPKCLHHAFEIAVHDESMVVDTFYSDMHVKAGDIDRFLAQHLVAVYHGNKCEDGLVFKQVSGGKHLGAGVLRYQVWCPVTETSTEETATEDEGDDIPQSNAGPTE